MNLAARRCLALATSAMLLVGSAAPVVAQTDDEAAEQAVREIADARDRANQAAEDFFAAESRLRLLELEQERLVMELEDLADLVEELRLAVEFVAVNRFVSSGASGISKIGNNAIFYRGASVKNCDAYVNRCSS